MAINKDSEAIRVARVRQLWRALLLNPEERTGAQVSIFYCWLEEHYPELLQRREGEPHQQLKSDLYGLWAD